MVAGDLRTTAGGTGVVGRALVRAAASIAAGRGSRFEALHLGSAEDVPDLSVPIRHFDGRSGHLAFRAMAAQMGRSSTALLFDHLGPSCMQAFVPRARRAPYAVYVHGIELWRPMGWYRKRALRCASVVLANSRYTVSRALAAGCQLPEVAIVPPVLEERQPEGRVDERLLAELGKGFLLIAGRMSASERYKGHEELLDAFVDVRRTAPSARLVVAGGGDDVDRLRRRAGELGLDDSAVRFTGFVSEATLDALFDAALAFVMPSRDEGFGLVYLSAMRASKPCVALRGTAAEDLVAHDETGLLVPPDDRASLASALVSLLADTASANRLGAQGRRRWEVSHRPAAFRSAVERVVDRLLKESDVRH